MNLPVLFIHGLVGHMHAQAIADTFGSRALAPNLLGYGEHRAYAGDKSLLAQVEFLRAFLAEHSHPRVHLVGHSIGGAIAMLFARTYPDNSESVISVEGNFTLEDAFWSKEIAESPLAQVQRKLEGDRREPDRWLRASGVTPTPERIDAAVSHLENQDAPAMIAMASSVVEITSQPKYLDDVMTVLNNGTRVHLIAGERSREAWDVPAFVLDAAEMTLLPQTGHLVTIESPQRFAAAVASMT